MGHDSAADNAFPVRERYGVAVTPVEAVACAPGPPSGVATWLWVCLACWGLLLFSPVGVLTVAPLAAGMVLIARDYDRAELAVLARSRLDLSAFDRQRKVTWLLGGFVLPFIYLPMYALKRAKLAQAARCTVDYDWVLNNDETARLRAAQRWHVIGLWVVGLALLLLVWIGAVLASVFLMFMLKGPAH